MSEQIEVVCLDMHCFKVDPVTLDPISCGYYEPAAWSDPRGPQMSFAEWSVKRAEQRTKQFSQITERNQIEV